jgi:DNA polymerase-3 subunit epsilon
VKPLIAVIDTETTGLSPKSDRVVEVAAILASIDGRPVERFVTLVNPGRDVGPTSIHGLTPSMLSVAPTFSEIALDLVQFLSRARVWAGHNVAFDLRMLAAEFTRVGVELPRRTTLCTMNLAGGGRLDYCCDLYGIKLVRDRHDAQGDAEATAQLLAAILADDPAERARVESLPAVETVGSSIAPAKRVTRDRSIELRSTPPHFIRTLLSRADRDGPLEVDTVAALSYANALEQALRDRQFSEDEASHLTDLAVDFDLGPSQLLSIHCSLLERLARAYLSDGTLEASEFADLRDAARLLGVSCDLDGVIAKCQSSLRSEPSLPTPRSPKLVGASVCFTGEIDVTYRGAPLTREQIEQLAAAAGLTVKSSVTKQLNLLVCADATTQSGKEKKARQYGIELMNALEFLRHLHPALNARGAL